MSRKKVFKAKKEKFKAQRWDQNWKLKALFLGNGNIWDSKILAISTYISYNPENLKQIGDYDFQKVARMTHFETDVAASNDLQQRTKPHKDGDGGNGSSNSKKTEMTNHMC